MVRTKLTTERIRRVSSWLLNKRVLLKRNKSYKIEMLLPERKQVDIKKNGQFVKTITVRRKSKYFND